MRKMFFAALAMIISLPVLAQPLVDSVPHDADIYFGYAGSKQLEKSYDKSNLKTILEPNGQAWTGEDVFDALINLLEADDSEDVKELRAAIKLLKPSIMILKDSPVAFYATANMESPEESEIGFLVAAGDKADILESQIEALIKLADDEQMEEELQVINQGGVVRISVNAPEEIKRAQNLGRSAKFMEVVAKTGTVENGAMFAYVDIDSLKTKAEKMEEALPDENAKMVVSKSREILSLDSFKSFYAVSGFEGAEWKTIGWLKSEGELTGLPKLLFGKTLDAGMISAIPGTAVSAAGIRFDLGEVFNYILSEVEKIEQNAPDMVKEFEEMATQQIGVNPRSEILEQFGSDWIMYMDPTIAGDGPLGLIFMNNPKDAGRLKSALVTVANRVSEEILPAMMNEMAEDGVDDAEILTTLKIEFRDITVDGEQLYTCPLPLIAPSWTVREGRLIVGLYPQTVAVAASKVGTPGVDKNATLAKLLAEYKGKSLTAFAVDSPAKNLHQSYQAVLAIQQLGTGFINLFVEDAPVVYLPTMPQLKKILSPTAMVIYADKDGIRAASQQAFPGSEIFMLQGTGLGSQGAITAAGAAYSLFMNKSDGGWAEEGEWDDDGEWNEEAWPATQPSEK